MGAAVPTLSQARRLDETRLCGVPEERLREAWEIWRRARLKEAIETFRAWLRQHGGLFEAAQDIEAHDGRGVVFEKLCEQLANAPVYRRLGAIPVERRRIIAARLK